MRNGDVSYWWQARADRAQGPEQRPSLESARRSPRTSALARAGDLISGIPH